uniref:Methylthioribose-1-phosphate isomerase n=1 Tax=Rhizophora mucronata TaxID=61149 RepID=A0A2P2MA71_RHIMU
MAANSNSTGVDGALQSICYKRGSLQLLDQRKLPLETVYLDIHDSTDGWYYILALPLRKSEQKTKVSIDVSVPPLPMGLLSWSSFHMICF